MQNKANFGNDKMNITIDITSKYEILPRSKGQKTNPIQTQFNPKQTQLKPIQTQFKAKQSQSAERPKMLEFTLDVSSLAFLSGALAWIRNLTIVLIMLLADFTTLKGVFIRLIISPLLIKSDGIKRFKQRRTQIETT
jgi:hypothetical protein